ncbi:MAG: hypothetical protein P8Z00_13795 [Anaerolineales bacterium]
MMNSGKTILRHITGILMAMVAWWAITVLVGLALYMIWPPAPLAELPGADVPTVSFMAGVSLGAHWQNIPGNVLGFIGALYAFRAICPKTVSAAAA